MAKKYNSLNTSELARAVAASKLVGLGESSHGTHEFFNFKAEFFQRLVTDYGFNTLLFESEQVASRAVNDYISGGDTSLESARRALYPVWQTEELEQLLIWLRDQLATHKIIFEGFDINQDEYDDLSARDELMAANIRQYCQDNPDTKAVVWAHNSHIQAVGSDWQPRSMGSFLRKSFGQQYQAIGLLFGQGSVSACKVTEIINEKEFTTERAMSAIEIGPPDNDLAEAVLGALFDKPVILTQSEIERMNLPNEIRSIGWCLVPEQIHDTTESTDLKRAFDYVVYFPEGTHSQPL